MSFDPFEAFGGYTRGSKNMYSLEGDSIVQSGPCSTMNIPLLQVGEAWGREFARAHQGAVGIHP